MDATMLCRALELVGRQRRSLERMATDGAFAFAGRRKFQEEAFLWAKVEEILVEWGASQGILVDRPQAGREVA